MKVPGIRLLKAVAFVNGPAEPVAKLEQLKSSKCIFLYNQLFSGVSARLHVQIGSGRAFSKVR